MNGDPGAWIAAFAVIIIALALALLESALPVLCRGGRSLPAGGLKSRMAADPARTRRAARLMRLVSVAAIVLSIALAASAARGALATLAALAIAAVYLLERGGQLRRLGARFAWLADGVAAVLHPMFLMLRSAQSGDGAAALADALASESLERQGMVQAMLELENRAVEDIMVPRSDVVWVDLGRDWSEALDLVHRSPHTRLPVCDGDLDRVVGIAHMKRIANELAAGRLDPERLREIAAQRSPLFVPEGTSLQSQLIRFRRLRRRIAFVVDEYGSVQGIVTLEDILEEIVGEFTTQPTLLHREWEAQPDGSYLIAGGATLRSVNRALGWALPTGGPRTISGLIVEYLESIPDPGTALKLGDYAIEVLQVAGNAVRTARVWPPAVPPAP